jgi:NADPH-dependent ferric siderophore reductase
MRFYPSRRGMATLFMVPERQPGDGSGGQDRRGRRRAGDRWDGGAVDDAEPAPTSRLRRREPPAFRRLEVARVARLSPHMVRITLGGPELDGLTVDQPAASVRLLLPPSGSKELVMPSWNGNEFLLPDGRRPPIRTFTPRRVDADARELDLDIVLHGGGGAASTWAAAAAPGDVAAVSGPGRGYAIEATAPGFLLAGDETAIAAIGQLLESLPAASPVAVHVEVNQPDARLSLPDHPAATVSWSDRSPDQPPGHTLVDAVRDADIPGGTRVWAAGEAAAMQRIRRHLFEERGRPRAEVHVRGYWKPDRAGDDDEA